MADNLIISIANEIAGYLNSHLTKPAFGQKVYHYTVTPFLISLVTQGLTQRGFKKEDFYTIANNLASAGAPWFVLRIPHMFGRFASNYKDWDEVAEKNIRLAKLFESQNFDKDFYLSKIGTYKCNSIFGVITFDGRPLFKPEELIYVDIDFVPAKDIKLITISSQTNTMYYIDLEILDKNFEPFTTRHVDKRSYTFRDPETISPTIIRNFYVDLEMGIYNFLYVFRTLNSMSISEMAKFLKVNVQTYQEWESGTTIPSPKLQKKIIEKTGISATSFARMLAYQIYISVVQQQENELTASFKPYKRLIDLLKAGLIRPVIPFKRADDNGNDDGDGN
ncbi:MAG: helix-turn-helix transcriptional regulator [bacterium]